MENTSCSCAAAITTPTGRRRFRPIPQPPPLRRRWRYGRLRFSRREKRWSSATATRRPSRRITVALRSLRRIIRSRGRLWTAQEKRTSYSSTRDKTAIWSGRRTERGWRSSRRAPITVLSGFTATRRRRCAFFPRRHRKTSNRAGRRTERESRFYVCPETAARRRPILLGS